MKLFFVFAWALMGMLPLAQAQGRLQPGPEQDEVTDRRSGLVWRRCLEGMEWRGKACTGKSLFLPYPSTLTHASEVAARSGKPWRLPTVKELTGLANPGEADPSAGIAAIDAVAFPGTPPSRVWTSSSAGPHYFMFVSFIDGSAGENTRVSPATIRLVRSAQP